MGSPGKGKRRGSGTARQHDDQDYDARKHRRAKNFDFTLKLESEKRKIKENKNSSKRIEEFALTSEKKDDMVQSNLQSQTEVLKKKLERRKKRSFQKSLYDKSGSHRDMMVRSRKKGASIVKRRNNSTSRNCKKIQTFQFFFEFSIFFQNFFNF